MSREPLTRREREQPWDRPPTAQMVDRLRVQQQAIYSLEDTLKTLTNRLEMALKREAALRRQLALTQPSPKRRQRCAHPEQFTLL